MPFWTVRPVVFSFNRRVEAHHAHHFRKKAKILPPRMTAPQSAAKSAAEKDGGICVFFETASL
jgi:hypothetical protein